MATPEYASAHRRWSTLEQRNKQMRFPNGVLTLEVDCWRRRHETVIDPRSIQLPPRPDFQAPGTGGAPVPSTVYNAQMEAWARLWLRATVRLETRGEEETNSTVNHPCIDGT